MIYFTADHHFGHRNIIQYCARPFSSVDEMNEEMVHRWNNKVGIDDVVYYLGDFSLSKSLVVPFASRLNGKKILIMGNHDVCHPTHKKKAVEGMEIYKQAGFKDIVLETTIEIAGQNVILNHMPYLEEEPKPQYKTRFQNYRPKRSDNWLIHGHVHEKWKTKDKMLNVGVDVWDFCPVSIEEIERIITS